VAVLLATGASAADKPAADPEELDIAETVFRYQMAQPTELCDGHESAAFYLEFKDGDPPWELLNRYADHTPPVKSQSDVDHTTEMAVRDWRTKRPGIRLFVHTSSALTETKATVTPDTTKTARVHRTTFRGRGKGWCLAVTAGN